MLRLLLRAVEVLLIGLIGYNLIIAVFGWRNPKAVPQGKRDRRFRVVIPAHNEERVIGNLLEDLSKQDYPTGLSAVWVLADRCTDSTAEIGRNWAHVAERTGGLEGKGAGLSWYLDEHRLGPDEALVVLDADNRVPSDLLTRLADQLDSGSDVIQVNIDVANPDASSIATASALSYWASNRMVQLARHNLGWPVDLGGTGMCFTATALERVGSFGTTAVEDQEMGVRLFLAGIPVAWAHQIRIEDEKPSSADVAVRQRARWASGRRQVARRHLGDLLRRATPASVDLAIRLVQPSRMGVAMASAGLALASGFGLPTLGAGAWAAVATLQFLAPIPFLVREGVPARYLARYPVLAVLPLLKIPARLIRQRGWYHTPHQG